MNKRRTWRRRIVKFWVAFPAPARHFPGFDGL
jgi:hypothetical protein